jgi:nickel-dependent lactate racemase
MKTSDWKNIELQYGKESLNIEVPPWCDTLTLKDQPALANPGEQIKKALQSPSGGRKLSEIIAASEKPPSQLTAAITVSDNTRPVPYNGNREDGILLPLLTLLNRSGIDDRNILIIIGTGTHVPTSDRWKKEAFGTVITERYSIIDHDCSSPNLFFLSEIEGIPVRVNRKFMESDIHITTGLVEPHFMAGVSGGRKAVCPGLINVEATNVFHGAGFIGSPNADNLILENNPCHEFSLKVARKARVDYNVSVTLNRDMELSGVFAGDLESSHLEAYERVKESSLIQVDHEYDIVLTQGGSVAINHYQSAKAACGAVPILKKGGIVILAAHNGDPEPVGKENYKRLLKLYVEKKRGKFTDLIESEEWEFVPDQWEIQKWEQFFRKAGSFGNLIYCTTGIKPEILRSLPCKSGYELADTGEITDMVQQSVYYAVERKKQTAGRSTMAFVKEGPYAVPLINY